MNRPHPEWIVPRWGAPGRVGALITTRAGGCSLGPFAAGDGSGGMNLGLGADDPHCVARNRARLRACLPGEPRWLHQVHAASVVDAAGANPSMHADASVTARAGVVCCVLVADCLPVLLADARGRGVGAAHAGWRGLAAGVLGNAVDALRAVLGDDQARVLAFLGPAIGPARFEVGPEVLAAMQRLLPDAAGAFTEMQGGKQHADLYALARQALVGARLDPVDIEGGGWCTASQAQDFYSFRRDRVTGRHAALIWLKT